MCLLSLCPDGFNLFFDLYDFVLVSSSFVVRDLRFKLAILAHSRVPTAEAMDTVARAQLSSYSQGKKLAILVNGTRGDVQAVGALGSFLQASGFQVLVSTNVDHVGFIEKLGMKAVGCHFDFEKSMHEHPGLSEAMAAGDMFKAMDGMKKVREENFPSAMAKEWEALKEFQPDLLLYHLQCSAQGEASAQALKIPALALWLSPFLITKVAKSLLGERCCHWTAWLLFISMILNLEKEKMPVLKNMLAKDIAADEFWNPGVVNGLQEWMRPITPVIVGISGIVYPVPTDVPETTMSKINLTGFWVVNPGEQERRLKAGDSNFGGSSLGPLSEFLSAGEKPVYMGWGSMIAKSSEHMACIAVRSLKKAGLRGIIVGGWAHLEAKHLDGQPDSAELHEYAAKSVLFLSTAPHEWLFPQCMATVHHGGAGTTAAALRSGVPTIVTPCMMDQYDNADLASKSGAGIRLAQLHKLTPETLSKALLRCKTDEKLVRTAAAVGVKLRGEDGLTIATQTIDKFLQEEVATGQWSAAMESRIKKRREFVARPPSCFCFFLRALCGCEKTFR